VTDLAGIQQWRGLASVGWLAVLLAWETAAPFFVFFRDPRERGLHALRNLVVGLVNAVVVGSVFVLAWPAVNACAGARHFGVRNWVGSFGASLARPTGSGGWTSGRPTASTSA